MSLGTTSVLWALSHSSNCKSILTLESSNSRPTRSSASVNLQSKLVFMALLSFWDTYQLRGRGSHLLCLPFSTFAKSLIFAEVIGHSPVLILETECSLFKHPILCIHETSSCRVDNTNSGQCGVLFIDFLSLHNPLLLCFPNVCLVSISWGWGSLRIHFGISPVQEWGDNSGAVHLSVPKWPRGKMMLVGLLARATRLGNGRIEKTTMAYLFLMNTNITQDITMTTNSS